MVRRFDKLSRRTLLQGAAGSTLALGLGMPAISRAQGEAIRIGHLTPLTGFLGPLGEYAQLGVKLAAEEINAAGGVLGRKIDLVLEDSVNPQTASAKAERLIERDKVAMIIGEISSASGLAIGQVANRMKTVFINTGCIPMRCVARVATRTCSTSRARTRCTSWRSGSTCCAKTS
jgi:branched-chain amino acid transport system substrate-binding protein